MAGASVAALLTRPRPRLPGYLGCDQKMPQLQQLLVLALFPTPASSVTLDKALLLALSMILFLLSGSGVDYMISAISECEF